MGVDFAVLDQINTYAVEGEPVQAVLSGNVAGLISERFPYGFAIMVETPLDDSTQYNPTWIRIPTPAPTRGPHPILTCPEPTTPITWDSDTRSLYLLYAHLQSAPDWQLGDSVTCGDTLGTIGSTGNAINPHLHLEIRVGPSGATFRSMAHYDASASPDEMANYCTWRVSDLFQVLDPMELLTGTP
jgi:murein DD-endopeptidase MepM/ murein hydrolase activator NlpD